MMKTVDVQKLVVRFEAQSEPMCFNMDNYVGVEIFIYDSFNIF